MTVVGWSIRDDPSSHSKIQSLLINQGNIWGGHHSSIASSQFFPLHIPRDLTTLYSFYPSFLLRSLHSLTSSLCAPHSLLPL